MDVWEKKVYIITDLTEKSVWNQESFSLMLSVLVPSPLPLGCYDPSWLTSGVFRLYSGTRFIAYFTCWRWSYKRSTEYKLGAFNINISPQLLPADGKTATEAVLWSSCENMKISDWEWWTQHRNQGKNIVLAVFLRKSNSLFTDLTITLKAEKMSGLFNHPLFVIRKLKSSHTRRVCGCCLFPLIARQFLLISLFLHIV